MDESVRDLWQSLGLPGLIDVHTHFMPKNVMDKVWKYFDDAGPLGNTCHIGLGPDGAVSAETARAQALTDLLAEYGADTCNGLVLVPFKCQLDDSDLTAEDYNAEGLLNYPVLADVGSIAINAGTSADGLKAAKSAALWLYSNGAGEDALTETLGVVTPWNTAAGTTAVTAMQVQQVGTGILPGVALDTAAADALTANELTLQDSEKHTKAERTAFVDGALAALGAE